MTINKNINLKMLTKKHLIENFLILLNLSESELLEQYNNKNTPIISKLLIIKNTKLRRLA